MVCVGHGRAVKHSAADAALVLTSLSAAMRGPCALALVYLVLRLYMLSREASQGLRSTVEFWDGGSSVILFYLLIFLTAVGSHVRAIKSAPGPTPSLPGASRSPLIENVRRWFLFIR